jgi:hypothetical protein
MNLLQRVQIYSRRRSFRGYRLGKFWCNKHWKIIEDSQFEDKPINPSIAALGITAALHLKDVSPAYVRNHGAACCILVNIADGINKVSGKEFLNGIFERSRGWKAT